MVTKRGLGGLGRTPRPRLVGYQVPLRPRIGYDEQIFPQPGDYDALKAEEWDMEQQQQLQDWQRPQELGYPNRYEQPIGYRPSNPMPFIPSPPSLQDRLPEGWATEGWPAQWPPPPPSHEMGLVPGGPMPGFNENRPFPPRREQPIGYRRRKPKRPKSRESEA